MIIDKNNKNFVKNPNAYEKYKPTVSNDILKLYYQFTHLKNIYRQGWLTSLLGKEYENKIESVADHTWAVTMLAFAVLQKYELHLDISKCMELALVHELGEIYAGDYIPNQIDKNEKHKLEEAAVDKLLEDINFDNDFKKLWLEYENKESEEAKFIKQVDKLECILQATSYGLNAKYIKGASDIDIPCLVEILNEVCDISKENQLPLSFRRQTKNMNM